MFAKLRQLRGRMHAGLTKLEIPLDPTESNYKQCKQWITIDTPKEIEQLMRNATNKTSAKRKAHSQRYHHSLNGLTGPLVQILRK